MAVNNTKIFNVVSEDALNLYHTNFSIRNLQIYNTVSDALDIDFSSGEISELDLNNIGGDGVDISGTKLSTSGMLLNNIFDKAISVGENSNYEGNKETINGAGTAIAVKDSSTARLSNSKLENIHEVAFMAYIKKNFFTKAMLTVDNTIVDTTKDLAIAQFPSKIIIDGKEVKQQFLDTEKMYQFGRMKKRK